MALKTLWGLVCKIPPDCWISYASLYFLKLTFKLPPFQRIKNGRISFFIGQSRVNVMLKQKSKFRGLLPEVQIVVVFSQVLILTEMVQ